MTDVVSRLRVMSFMICGEAADTIEAQAERIRVLRESLQEIADLHANRPKHHVGDVLAAMARAALKATK